MRQIRDHLISDKILRPVWYDPKSTRNSNKIFLDKNENNDKNLKKIYHSIFKKYYWSSISYYPNSFDCYRELAKLNSVSIKNILIGAGSDGIIRSVFETFVKKGDIVLKTKPTFQMYDVYSKIYQAKTIDIEYENNSGKIEFDFTKFVRAIKKNNIKLICLPNPDSPTGTIVNEKQLDIILKVSQKKGAMVLIDEAYYPFYSKTAVKFLKKYKNLIITRTFAKAWGLAGLRIGYSISNTDVNKYLHKVKSMYEVNTFAAHLVPKIISKKNYVINSVKNLNKSKDFMIKELNKLGFKTTISFGNFFHVNFGVHSNKIHRALKKHVLYKENFSEKCLKGYSRFSLTNKTEFKKILKIISRVLN